MSEKKARKAYAKLQSAADKFSKAILEFESKYTPNNVGLSEWLDYNSDVLADIEFDIDSEYEDESN